MTELCRQYESNLASVGLRANPKKSASLVITTDGKRKRWLVDSRCYLTLADKVAPMDVTTVYRNLETSAGVRVTLLSAMEKLKKGLRNLTLAPLKPQQMMYFLGKHTFDSQSPAPIGVGRTRPSQTPAGDG